MNVPPFPPQDLAKLVLGYLSEEQLMTVYDEFLQASPYLDALQNEYDWIFMTSLKNILAEYRAVKIFVETCKPLLLRKRLVQCANLLEMFKCLVNHVDMNKVHNQDVAEKAISSMERQKSKQYKILCDVCNLMNLPKCVCKNKNCNEENIGHKNSNLEATTECSVETTSLNELPGHQNNETILEAGKTSSHNTQDMSAERSEVLTSQSIGNTCEQGNMVPNDTLTGINNPLPVLEPAQTSQNDRLSNIVPCIEERQMSVAGTFQDFSTGIREQLGPDSGHTNVPDSSTSENYQVTTTKDSTQNNNIAKTKLIIRERKTPYFVKVDNNNLFSTQSSSKQNVSAKSMPGCSKSEEHKITIISDVKVEQRIKNCVGLKQIGMPQVLKNATSTPLQMQTIMINGIPAFRQVPVLPTCDSKFTKDEIMAMPTIIIAPTSSSSVPVPSTTSQRDIQVKTMNQVSSIDNSLPPLVVDVESNSPVSSRTQVKSSENQIEIGLVKTVDIKHKNPSVPKDNVVTTPGKINTPHVVPPLRKSSSTPRRSSHIRALDFATPRRILHETINENVQENSESQVEVLVSRSPNLANNNLVGLVENNVSTTFAGEEVQNINLVGISTKTKEASKNETPTVTKNWDAGLRAFSIAHPAENLTVKKSKTKKEYSNKNNTAESKSRKTKNPESSKRNKKKTMKDQEAQKKSKVIEIIEVEDVEAVENNSSVSHVVKPTINLITGIDKNSMGQETTKKNKSIEEKRDKSIEEIETPEAERLSLQNVIGAKLNISEFLETPYKQALYDIQMDTPKYLVPDIPGEPFSEIKIMSIPTPRFLNSPTAQATPSSYSSRPTDYSSSGSYYKPDDEFIPSAEILGYTSTSNKVQDSIRSEQPKEAQDKSKSRPVRQCTKNVSYCSKGKNKDSDDAETNSICSDLTKSKKVSSKSKTTKDALKSAKEKPEKDEPQKRTSLAKKHKTTVKKDTSKSFMKIKPRKCSPLKTPKSKKRSFSSPLKSALKKSVSNKDKTLSTTVVVSAPTKSRRKSSTPRKIHGSETFHSESSGHDSPDIEVKSKINTSHEGNTPVGMDSDTDQIALRWSDDGSQDGKSKDKAENIVEAEDITKIKEYIANSSGNLEGDGNLHMDLINRGFDAETAKKIERDLLGATPESVGTLPLVKSIENSSIISDTAQNKCLTGRSVESDASNNLQIDEDEEIEVIELSVSECNEESSNYISMIYDDTRNLPNEVKEPPKLKDSFNMEICIEDGITVRVRATELNMLMDLNYEDELNLRETEMAVSSISNNFTALYTPMKEAVRAKWNEIFDSTLTSLDTPLKANNSPRKQDCESSVTNVAIEEEKAEVKEKSEVKKRKRQNASISEESVNESKKTKSETQYLLNSANIQNIDIESVLKQLHGS